MENKIFHIESWIEDIVPLQEDAKILYIKEQIVATLMSWKFDSMLNDKELGRDYESSLKFKHTLNTIINNKSKELSRVFEEWLVEAMVEILTTKNFIFETMHLLDGKSKGNDIDQTEIEIYPPITLAPENMQRVINVWKTLKTTELSEFIECIRYHPTYKRYTTTLWREALEKVENENMQPLDYHRWVNYSYYAQRFLDIWDWKSYSYCTMKYIEQVLKFFWDSSSEVKNNIYEYIVKNLWKLTREKEEIIINKFWEDKYLELKNTIRDNYSDEYYNIFDLYM